jgi:small-conductance mechanosensitive channel
MDWNELLSGLWGSLLSAAYLAGAALVGFAASLLLLLLLRLWARRRGGPLAGSLLRRFAGPLRLTLPVLAAAVVQPFAGLQGPLEQLLRQLFSILIILAISWLLVRGAALLEDFLLERYNIRGADNLKARKLYTQIRYLRRVFAVVVAVLAAATILMNFEKVRQLGATILASAGILGIVLGFASQRSIALLFAGFQVALTQPIRIDDVVVIEGEWGRIEEITLSFVVVRIWDLRRLVVPISYFLEKPFQNWTRVSAEVLGTVYLYCDYSVPVEAVRAELQRALQDSPLWDGKAAGVQVTGASDRTLELRALVSASDASKLWDLRCAVREQLLGFLQREYPDSLPRLRAVIREPHREAGGGPGVGADRPSPGRQAPSGRLPD